MSKINCRPYKHLIYLSLFFVPVLLNAQTAGELDKLLEPTSVLSYSQAAKFVLSSIGNNDLTEEDAAAPKEAAVPKENEESEEIVSYTEFEQAVKNGWLSKNASPDSSIKLDELSFLLMEAFGIKGGLMYKIIPGPRYAYRSLVSRSLIRGTVDPSMKVSGTMFLNILGNVLDTIGGEI